MRIVFFGTPEFAVTSFQKLIETNHHIIAVVTQPDKKRGRGNKIIASPVKELALKHDLPIWQPQRLKKDKTTLKFLKETEADFFVVVAYGQILSQEILAMPKFGCINVHGSILPQYRGAAPIQWSIYHGEKETGITTMLMDEGMDTGAMLLHSITPINLLDNAQNLSEKLAQQGADLLTETLEKLANNSISPIAQNAKLATYARLINKEDHIINWSESALTIHNQIRAFYPDCFTNFRGQLLKIMQTIPIDKLTEINLPPELDKLPNKLNDLDSFDFTGKMTGEIVKKVKNFGFLVKTGSGLLLILEVQLAGKKVQSAWNFCNGLRVELGEMLAS